MGGGIFVPLWVLNLLTVAVYVPGPHPTVRLIHRDKFVRLTPRGNAVRLNPH